MDTETFKSIKEIAQEYKEKLGIKIKSQTKFLSGFHDLDAITNGFQPSNLVIIGGSSRIGKSSFAISLIRKMALEKHYSIMFYSLQQSSQQVLQAIIAIETKIAVEKVQSHTLYHEELALINQTIKKLKSYDLIISDYPFQTIAAIERELRYYPPDYLPIVVIDSLQHIATRKKDALGKILNKNEMTEIAFRLKKMAVKYNIVVIAMFNFEIIQPSRRHYRPKNNDLIIQAPIHAFADIVLLLYRPEYYKISRWNDENEAPTAGQAEIIIAKNTSGKLENIRVSFNGKMLCFDNI